MTSKSYFSGCLSTSSIFVRMTREKNSLLNKDITCSFTWKNQRPKSPHHLSAESCGVDLFVVFWVTFLLLLLPRELSGQIVIPVFDIHVKSNPLRLLRAKLKMNRFLQIFPILFRFFHQFQFLKILCFCDFSMETAWFHYDRKLRGSVVYKDWLHVWNVIQQLKKFVPLPPLGKTWFLKKAEAVQTLDYMTRMSYFQVISRVAEHQLPSLNGEDIGCHLHHTYQLSRVSPQENSFTSGNVPTFHH